MEPALGQAAPVTGLAALAPRPAHGQAVKSVVDVARLGCCLTVSGRSLLRGLAGIALGVTSRGLQTATGLDGSVHVPLLVGEVAVTGLGHAIPLAALVTARLSPLTARSQRIEAGEPDVSCRRVWRP